MKKYFTAENRIKIGNCAVLFALFFLTIGCWNEYSWYEFLAPFGTVISFLALCIATACYAKPQKTIKEREFIMVCLGCFITLVNIFVVHSGIGAFFTAADLLLVLYLADKIRLGKKMQAIIALYIGFYFYYWTVDVKGYFKGYNTNYGGLVLITGFVFAILFFVFLLSYLKEKGKKKSYIALMVFVLFSFALAYNIIAWYRARCALLGLLVFTILLLIPKKLWDKRWLYRLLVFAFTAGSILVTVIYLILGRLRDYFTIQIFYKDIISGREEIWYELWKAFIARPITGIGSSYVINIDWMGGIFEVHNGLFDILVVHGSLVFAISFVLLVKKLMIIRENVVASNVSKVSMCGIMAILAASFMENFFIVPPFLLAFLLLFTIAISGSGEVEA